MVIVLNKDKPNWRPSCLRRLSRLSATNDDDCYDDSGECFRLVIVKSLNSLGKRVFHHDHSGSGTQARSLAPTN